MQKQIKYAVLTSSDSGHAGDRQDVGGDAIVDLMSENGHSLIARSLQPDDQEALIEQMRSWIKRQNVELILTTGGTGLAPRDVMPEATLAVIDYEVPGIAEAIACGIFANHSNGDALSRAVAGVARTDNHRKLARQSKRRGRDFGSRVAGAAARRRDSATIPIVATIP